MGSKCVSALPPLRIQLGPVVVLRGVLCLAGQASCYHLTHGHTKSLLHAGFADVVLLATSPAPEQGTVSHPSALCTCSV